MAALFQFVFFTKIHIILFFIWIYHCHNDDIIYIIIFPFYKPHIKSIDNFKSPDTSLTLRRNRLLWKINIKKKNTNEELNEGQNVDMNTMDLNNNIKMQNIMYSDQDHIKSLKENKKKEKFAKKELKKSLIRKMKSQKVYTRKRPKLYNIFALIDFYIEKKIFYRMCKIHNLIKGRNINKKTNGIHQYKNIIIIFSFPLIIFASGAIFFPLKYYLFSSETYLPYGTLASSVVSLLILIYILRKILICRNLLKSEEKNNIIEGIYSL
ncbi:variable surface protein [Plasmodium gonderi]|uniref:Variable surface protein n=1 Tax=Plasmodium gonderi TaxID=77519 RepID=A0A1Y1JTP7_PLAGO|nr:variable surface protein [Plasmodium gonderi]GAW84132.1 variable surface protein [Plasmodium gonderi]